MVNHETERSLAIALAHVPGAFTVTSELRVERHPQTPAP
jgi:hypothetical protein